MINKLSKKVHQNAKDKGFFDNEKNIGEMLCLIHSEVSEALEADRKDKYFNKGFLKIDEVISIEDETAFMWKFGNHVKDTFEDELADIMIRVMDLAEFKGINLEKHIKAKMRHNSNRDHKHGKKY
jgi:NTP pyrophosphatase (non-canonical NTP hydrolase)